MARKRYKPEEIVAKLRQVDVLVSQGQGMTEALGAFLVNTTKTDVNATREPIVMGYKLWQAGNTEPLSQGRPFGDQLFDRGAAGQFPLPIRETAG